MWLNPFFSSRAAYVEGDAIMTEAEGLVPRDHHVANVRHYEATLPAGTELVSQCLSSNMAQVASFSSNSAFSNLFCSVTFEDAIDVCPGTQNNGAIY